jgi:hypothetical protein
MSSWDNADLANRQTATGVVNFSNCTFLERDDKIIDAATVGLAGMGTPCAVSEGTLWQSSGGAPTSVGRRAEFLRVLFQLQRRAIASIFPRPSARTDEVIDEAGHPRPCGRPPTNYCDGKVRRSNCSRSSMMG